MSGVVMRTLLRGTLGQIRHVRPVPPRQATGAVADVYRQAERDFGLLAPPVALHSPAPGALAAAWTMLRETLIAGGKADRATKETVAAAVSEANTCPYCVEVHTAALRSAPSGPVAAWAGASGTRASTTRPPGDAALLPELLGVATTFQYLNRMVNVFLPASPLPGGMPAAARERARGLLAKVMRPSAGPAPGASAALLPAAPLPADLGWAAGSPTVSAAFAAAAPAVDATTVVPDAVRDLLHDHLAGWDGTPPGLSRAWVDDAVASLPATDRAAGRLALLTAVASYQVDDTVVAAYREDMPGDAPLVELTSWAALTTARHISTWTAAVTDHEEHTRRA